MGFKPKTIYALLILFLHFGEKGMAQLCFDADVTRGCAPLTISIIECVGSNVDKSSLRYNYEYQPGDPPGGTTDTFHTYALPGIYSIQQTGNVDGSGDTFVRTNYIEVLASPDPEFFVFVCDNNGIVIQITDIVYEEYIFDFMDGSPLETLDVSISDNIFHQYASPGQQDFSIKGNYVPGGCGAEINGSINTIAEVPIPQITNFQTSLTPYSISFDYSSVDRVFYDIYQSKDGGQNFNLVSTSLPGAGINSFSRNNPGDTVNNQCFRVDARDQCGNIISSETLCGIELEGEAQNNRNELNWSIYKGPNLDSFQVNRNGIAIAYFPSSFPPSPFYDSMVTCGEEYTYEILAIIGQSGTSSNSNDLDIRSFSTDTPATIINTLVSTDLDNTVITWDQAFNVVEYKAFAKFPNSNPGSIGTTTDTELRVDVQDRINRIPCFSITYQDSCNNDSRFSTFHCPVVLDVKTAPQSSHELDWTNYRGWDFGVALYEVQKVNLQGNVFFTQEFDSATFNWGDQGIDSSFQDFYYRIRAVENGADSTESFSNSVLVEQVFRIFFPTAFTPNGDGLNDVFLGKGRFVETYQLLVMNQWGEVIFESKELKTGWDGTFKGSDSPIGTYLYQVEATDEKGNTFDERGTITLIR